MSADTQLVRDKLDSECEEILHLDLQYKQTKFDPRLLQGHTLRSLKIQGIDNEQFMYLLCNGLKFNQAITSLTVSWYFEIAGLKAISEVIQCNTTITRLHIWEFQYVNNFSPKIALENNKLDCLAQALKHNTTLTSLCLLSDDTNCRRMSNENIKTILTALEQNNSLFDVRFLQYPHHLNSHETIRVMDDFLASKRMRQYQARIKRDRMWSLISLTCNFYRANVHSKLKSSILDLWPAICELAENTSAGQPQYFAEQIAKMHADRFAKHETERNMVNKFMSTKFFQAVIRMERVDIIIPPAQSLQTPSPKLYRKSFGTMQAQAYAQIQDIAAADTNRPKKRQNSSKTCTLL
jgi:hypothetical protein